MSKIEQIKLTEDQRHEQLLQNYSKAVDMVEQLEAELDTHTQMEQRVIASMEWMVKDMKWRADDLRQNIEEGSQGGYSPELTEVINLLEELKR